MGRRTCSRGEGDLKRGGRRWGGRKLGLLNYMTEDEDGGAPPTLRFASTQETRLAC